MPSYEYLMVYGPGVKLAGDGLVVPAIESQGISRGALGLEYLGDGYALGTEGERDLIFDTYVGDPTSGDGVPLTDDVSTDEFTYSTTSITPVGGGLYAIGFGVELSAPLTHPLRVILRGVVGGDTGMWMPVGTSTLYDNAVRAVRVGEPLGLGVDGIDAEDADTLVSYIQFGVFKVGAATPLA